MKFRRTSKANNTSEALASSDDTDKLVLDADALFRRVAVSVRKRINGNQKLLAYVGRCTDHVKVNLLHSQGPLGHSLFSSSQETTCRAAIS